jgi:hypothetical protein
MKQMFEVGVFGFRNDAPPLVKELVPVLYRASLEGVGTGCNHEHEARARACFLVALSHFALIAD